MKAKAAIVIVLLAAIAGGGYYYYTGTPRHSISQLGKAISNHDPEAAKKYVDFDQISLQLIQHLTPGAESLEGALAGSFMKLATPAIKPFVKKALESTFDQIVKGEGGEGSSSKMVRNAKLVGIVTHQDTAEVTVTAEDGTKWVCKMERTKDRYWKIVGLGDESLPNLSKLLGNLVRDKISDLMPKGD